MSPDGKYAEEKNRWPAAAAFSAALHLTLFLMLSFSLSLHTQPPEPIMTVRLIGAGESKNSGAEGAPGGGLPRAAAKKAEALSKAAEPAVRKSPPTRAQVRTQAQTQAAKQPPAPTQSAPAAPAGTASGISETSYGDTPAGSPENGNGSGVGSGSGTGTGIGSGSGTGTTGTGNGAGGHGGVADVSSLTVLYKVLPEYPLFSRKRGEEGTSVIIAALNDGTVTAAEVEHSSGFERLDTAALRAIKKWRFKENGALRVRIPFVFSLKK